MTFVVEVRLMTFGVSSNPSNPSFLEGRGNGLGLELGLEPGLDNLSSCFRAIFHLRFLITNQRSRIAARAPVTALHLSPGSGSGVTI